MHRRSFLVTATTAFTTAVGASTVTTATGEDMPTYESTRIVRGESDADVSVETEEDDEHVSYLEDEEKVEYVMAWRWPDDALDDDGDPVEEEFEDDPPEREPEYTTTDWDSWGKQRCRFAAAEAAADHVAEELELDSDLVGSGVSSRVPEEDSGAVVMVFDESDDLDLETDDLAAVTPTTVDTTYVLDDQEYEYEAPIFARIERYADETDEMDDDATGSGDGADENGATDDATTTDGNTGTADDEERASENETDGTVSSDPVPGFGMAAALGGVATSIAALRWRRGRGSIDRT